MRRTEPAVSPRFSISAAGDDVFALYGARDDVVLHLFAKLYEEGCVTGDAHKQVTVFFGMGLGLKEMKQVDVDELARLMQEELDNRDKQEVA